MALSNKTVRDLAKVLSAEVIEFIHNDERYVDFLHEIIPDAVQDKLGDIDEDLKFELSLCVMDRIFFTQSLHN